MATNQRKGAPDELLRARVEGRTYTPEQLANRAMQLEAKIVQLKNRYEQFFLGLERKPPTNDRDALHKELEMLRQISTKNTALKFKLNSLFNRFLSYERLWARTEIDIEEGRYRRDIFKARLRHRSGKLPSAEDVDMSDLDAAEDGSGAARAPNEARLADQAARSNLDEARLRSIYDTYLVARQECHESIDGLTFDHVAQRIRDQIPALLKQAQGKTIDFKVAIKDGKAILRAVTRD